MLQKFIQFSRNLNATERLRPSNFNRQAEAGQAVGLSFWEADCVFRDTGLMVI